MNALRSPLTDAAIEAMRERTALRTAVAIAALGNRWLVANPKPRLAKPQVRVLDRYWGKS